LARKIGAETGAAAITEGGEQIFAQAVPAWRIEHPDLLFQQRDSLLRRDA
jgi:hypothetical protein